ncbi:MAG: hypothetical protein H7039_10640 [Bryobacteraceae bacterium]|nr:hypothetical protein [Bryobacteraceae bacterium]
MMTSEEVPDSPIIASLFDFLYVDRPRLASYAAQLYNDGVLSLTKKVTQVTEGKSSGVKAGLKVLEAAFGDTGATQRLIERQFDSGWSLPLNLLDGLDEEGFIHDDIWPAGIGQVVLISGSLRILDIRLMRDLWGSAVKLARAGQKKKPDQHDTEKTVVEILSRLPHALQMNLIGSPPGRGAIAFMAWTTLNPEHMTVNPDDLAFKHGADLVGLWHCIAVVDALPEKERPQPVSSGREMEDAMVQMLSGLREAFGRPPQAFGVTPLLIFRKCERRPSAQTENGELAPGTVLKSNIE